MPPGPGRAQLELNLLMPMSPALIATKGYASADVEPTLCRALELSREIGDTEKEFSVLQGLSLFHLLASNLQVTRRVSEQLVDLAKNMPEPGADLAALCSLGYVLIFLGESDLARTYLDQVTAKYDRAIHDEYALRLGGSNYCVGSYSVSAWLYYGIGYPDQALDKAMQGMALAKELDYPISVAVGHWCLGMAHVFRGEPKAVLENANTLSGWARFETGDRSGGIAEIRQGIEGCHAIGSFSVTPYWQRLLAGCLSRDGQIEASLEIVAEALATIERTDEVLWAPDLLRFRGQLLLESDGANGSEAEACFLQAIDVARSHKAKSWELRAATSLVELWHS